MTKTIMAGGACACLAAALLAATPASADSPAGEYRGVMEDRGRPVGVVLQLEANRLPGDPAGRIRFLEPWVCGFELEYSGDYDHAAIHSFRGAGAGPCRIYTQGFARSAPAGDGLQLELVDGSQSRGPRIFMQPARR